MQSVRLHQRKKFAPTEAHRRWCRAVVLWTAGATAEKEAACIVTLRRAGLHALAFCRRGYQRGVPFGASLATFCASRKSPAPESGTLLLQKEAAYAASFFAFSQQSFAPAGKSAKRRRWRKQRADFEEAAGELPANAGKATPAATVGSPQAKESLRFLNRASRLRGSRHPR